MKKIKICPFCSEDIDNTSKICPFCAENLEDEATSEELNPKKQNKEIEVTHNNEISKKREIHLRIANQFKDHLEFLWFNIDDIEENEDPNNSRVLLISTHQKRSNLLINILSEDFVLISARYTYETSTEKDKLLDIYTKINNVNSNCLLTRWYFNKWEDKDGLINIEFWMRAYSKIDFTRNLDLMEEEIRSYVWLFTESN